MKNRFAPIVFALLVGSSWVLAQEDVAIKATTKMRPDGSTATTVIDPGKRTSEESLTDPKGKLLKRTVYSLDERNFATGAVHYGPKGEVRYKETFKLDIYDRVSESTLSSATGQVLGRRIFQYDSRGNTRIDDYDANGVLITRPEPAVQRAARPDKPANRTTKPAKTR